MSSAAALRTAIPAVFIGLLPMLALAQDIPAAAAEAPSFRVGYEWHQDRLIYEFENPSKFDTDTLVPHSFRQRYTSDNHWVAAAARYRFAGTWMDTQAGLAPTVTASASDIDTFYNPNGDVITSGTEGDARWTSFRFAQRADISTGRLTMTVGYSYRRDRADYEPADIVVVHSRPPATSRTFTDAPEFVTSQIHRVPVTMAYRRPLNAWSLVLHAETSPLLRAVLSIQLPEKYPGQVLGFHALGFDVGGGVAVARAAGGIPWRFGATYMAMGSYRASSRVSGGELALTAGIEWVK